MKPPSRRKTAAAPVQIPLLPEDRRAQALAFWQAVYAEFPCKPVARLIELLKDPRFTGIGDKSDIEWSLYRQFPCGVMFKPGAMLELETNNSDSVFNTTAVFKRWARLQAIMAQHPSIVAALPAFSGRRIDDNGDPV